MPTPILYLLLAVSLAAAQNVPNDDTLKSALEAISRRQRDLATSGGSGYFAGLSQYRFPQREPEDELAFLAPAREFAGDGQPENIGYGYQKSAPSTSTIYTSAPQILREGIPGNQRTAANNKAALEKLLIDYLEDEYKNGNTEDPRYYHQVQDATKRSVFRERDISPESEGHHRQAGVGRLEAIRKRGPAMLPTVFRERVNNKLVTDEDDFDTNKQRQNFVKMIAKEIEEEEEEDMKEEQEREQREEEGREEEYLELLQNLWEKYKQSNPSIEDIEDLTAQDIQQLLSLGTEGGDRNLMDEIKTEAVKRQYGDSYGTGYDYFNHPGAMNSWGAIQYKKRSKQHLEGNDNPQGSFLYSLKFVSPSSRGEAVEALKEEEALEFPDERDEDVLRMAANNYNRQEEEVWVPAFDREENPEDVYENNEENYQRFLLSPQNSRSASKKRTSQSSRANFSVRPLISSELVVPDSQIDKRYLYEAAKRKRFPVTKRSSNFYTSPPLLHHKSFSPIETRKKKDASIGTSNSATDPKVARELNQIFSSPSVNNEDLSEETAHHSKVTSTPKTESPLDHEMTTHASILSQNSSTNNSLENTKRDTENKDDKQRNESAEHSDLNHHDHQSLGDEETVEQPITMSRIQTPLEIKKKSIDWSDYFGIDRRKKNAGPVNINELEGSGDGVVDDNWLLNQYYKTLALSTGMRKRMPLHNPEHEHSMAPSQMKEKKEHDDQPFDTRLFDADIFSRSAQREDAKRSGLQKGGNEESRIDNMDSKLRNIEDVIVNEAIKYTGSHEGATDPKEVQEVKDRILSRLAAAYSLEKMRLALREFKSSLQAQKMSKYNPENQRTSQRSNGNDDDKKDKRVAVKKEKADEENKEEGKEEDEEKKKKRDDKKDDEIRELTNSLSDIEPLSEGYMGRPKPNKNHEECPVLNHILHKCHNVASLSGDEEQLFVPLCSLHQICYICGPEVGYSSRADCDLRFLTEADSLCMEDVSCQQVARRSAMTLRHSQLSDQCWSNSCIAHYFLTSWSR